MNLELILKSTKSIEIEFVDDDNRSIRLHTLIDQGYNYDTNNLTMLAPRKDKINYPFRHGDVLTVFFVDKSGRKPEVYSFRAKIMKKELSNNMVTETIKKISEISHVQRRNAFRFPISKKISLVFDEVTYDIITKDLSSGGLRFIIKKKLNANSIAILIITLDDGTEICTNAIVLSSVLQKDSNSNYDTRVEFIDIKNNEKDKLVNYIFKKQTESLKKLPNSDSAENIYKLLYGDYEEKRLHKDILVRVVDSISYFSWVMLFLMVIYFIKSSPETSYGVGRFFRTDYDKTWNQDLLNFTFFISTFQVLITSIGLSLNSLRLKRESDSYRKSLIINLAIAIVMILFIMYFKVV